MNQHLADVLIVWAVLLPGWLIGSIPIGWLIAKYKFHVNLLEHGSGGIGETNFVRALIEVGIEKKRAKRWGFIVQILDQIKGFGPVLWAMNIHQIGSYQLHLDAPCIALLGMGLILGHRCSAYLKFRGGKAVATTMGIALALYWPIVYVPVSCYVVWFVLKKIWAKKTSENTALASLAATSLLFILSVFLVHNAAYLLLIIFALLQIFDAHRSNLKRYREEQKGRVAL